MEAFMTTLTENVPFREVLKSIPGIFGIRLEEGPKYHVIIKEGHKEIRKYHSFLMAQTFVKGSFEEAPNEAFKRLANYIFGENEAHENLGMTSPVFMARAQHRNGNSDEAWMMSFVLSEDFNEVTLPRPRSSLIHIKRIPSLTVASLRYGGNNELDKMEQYAEELQQWIKKYPVYQATSEARWAQYDAPFTIPILKRNEAQMTLERKSV
jgi:hypothetical protein